LGALQGVTVVRKGGERKVNALEMSYLKGL